MIVYAMFENGEIHLIPFDTEELRKNGTVELEGVKYNPTDIGGNCYVADLEGKRIQVFIVKRKDT